MHRWVTDSHTVTLVRFVDSDSIAQKHGKATAEPEVVTFDLPLEEPVSSLGVTGEIHLKSPRSLMRLIVTDKQLNEYLVYEAYPLITSEMSPEGGVVSIHSGCQETCFLPEIRATKLRVELVSASITITAIDVVSSSAMRFSATELTRKTKESQGAQEKEIVNTLSRQITAAGLKWIPGPTAISKLPYVGKMKLFRNGKVPNLQGFEYYKGGIFELPHQADTVQSPGPTAPRSSFVPAFDWRARHRANDPTSPYYDGDPTGSGWITSVKSQLCSDCWAHSATGAVEAGVNLYFNQHLDLDLSEQQLVSCSGAGSCSGGNPGSALFFIMNSGIVDEACFPENGVDQPCGNICTSPPETIQIGGYEDIYPSDGTDNIKQRLINQGPVTFGIISWWHAIVLVGYETDVATGEPVWILKNSWGQSWGDNGYFKMIVDLSDIYLTDDLLLPFISRVKPYEISCRDEDHDGYYNWGTSLSKPASCGSVPSINDCNDADATVALQLSDGSCIAPHAVVSLSPTDLSFPSQAIGTSSAPQSVALSVTSDLALHITSISTTGDFSQTNDCGTAVSPHGACTIKVTFQPSASGNRSGSLTIHDDGIASPHTVSLTGIGEGDVMGTVAPNPLTFGLQLLRTTSAVKAIALTNTGTAKMFVNNVTVSGDFAIAYNYCMNGVKPGTHCNVGISFKPVGGGNRVGKLTLTTTATNSPHLVDLVGTGTQVKLSAQSIAFPTQLVQTTSATKQVQFVNTGSTAVTINGIAVVGNFVLSTAPANPCPTTGSVSPGHSCNVAVAFRPMAVGTKSGSVRITSSDPATPHIIKVSGTGTVVKLSTQTLTFGTTVIGHNSPAKQVTVTNVGNAPLPIAGITSSGDFGQTNNCQTNIPAKGSCLITVTFTPTAIDGRTGTVAISNSDAASPQAIALKGTGTKVAMSATSINFGTIAKGSTATKTVTLTNVGTTPITFTSFTLTGTNATDFSSPANPPCGGIANGGATCTMTLRFTPSLVGMLEKATISLYDDGGGSPQRMTLIGTGK